MKPDATCVGSELIVGYPEVIPFTRVSGRVLFVSSRGLLTTNLALFPRLLQPPIPRGMDFLLTPGEHLLRRDVADGAVQANVVVMLDIALYQSPRIFQRQRRSPPDALAFERFVPPFDLDRKSTRLNSSHT